MQSFGTSPLELMACEAMLQGLVFIDEFTYSARFTSATALASLNQAQIDILINGDSDFIVQEQNFLAYDATPTLVADPNVLITVTRGGSGRQMMSQSQSLLTWGGNYSGAKVPGRKPAPGFFLKSQTISIKLENLTTTNFNRIDIAFKGFKVFYITNNQGQTGDRTQIFHIA